VTVTDLETHSGDLVTYAARLVRAVRRAVEHPTGVRVLSLLDEHGPLGVSALASADRCSQPTMSGTVASLVEAGLVTKDANPDDARGSLVALTDDGRTELARVRQDNGREVAERLSRSTCTAEDLQTAIAVLRAALDPLEKGSQ
jgi:DNA-binding MarR family transcriptional regulator